jgi:hypothetical protein
MSVSSLSSNPFKVLVVLFIGYMNMSCQKVIKYIEKGSINVVLYHFIFSKHIEKINMFYKINRKDMLVEANIFDGFCKKIFKIKVSYFC